MASHQEKYEKRFYRDWSDNDALFRFEVKVRQSDLLVLCDKDLADTARTALLTVRNDLEDYICAESDFAASLTPVSVLDDAPLVIQKMADAGRAWEVGPMAAVAGVTAELVGRELLKSAQSVLVENGGDIFALSPRPVRFCLYAGEASPFKSSLVFAIDAKSGLGICTSSGKVGPSMSFGRADAVVAIHSDAAFADAAATAIANRIKTPDDVSVVVEKEKKRNVLEGLIVCCGDRLGMWGDFELIKP